MEEFDHVRIFEINCAVFDAFWYTRIIHTFQFITMISLASILPIFVRRKIILFNDFWVQWYLTLKSHNWSKRTEVCRFTITLYHTGWFNGFYQWKWGFQLLLDFFDMYLLSKSLLLLGLRGGILTVLGREKFHNKKPNDLWVNIKSF